MQDVGPLRTLLAQALADGDANAEATARTNLAVVALGQGEPASLALFEDALAATRRASSVRSEAILLVNFVPALLERGAHARALELAERAAQITARGAIEPRVVALLHLGRVWALAFAERGQAAQALAAALSALEDYAQRKPDRIGELQARLARPLAEAAAAVLRLGDHALSLRALAWLDADRAAALARAVGPTAAGDGATAPAAPAPAPAAEHLVDEATVRVHLAREHFDRHEFASAAEQWRHALALFEQQGRRAEQIDALLCLASPALSPLTAAVAAATQAVTLARQGDSSSQLANALATRGQLLSQQRQHGPAMAALREAMQLDPRPELARLHARAQVAAGQAHEALPLLTRTVGELRGAAGEPLMAALVDQALAMRALGQRAAALAALRDARSTTRGLPPSRNLALALNHLGWAWVEAGAVAEGAVVLDEALDAARRAHAADAEQAVLANLGMALTAAGEYDGAVASLEAARALARASGDLLGEGRSAFGLANVAASRRDAESADALYREAVGMAQQVGDTALEAAALDSAALLQAEAGRPALAIDPQRRAAALHHAAGAWMDEATDHLNLASSYLVLHETAHAAEALAAARALAQQHGLAPLAPYLAVVSAQGLAQQGDWPAARASYQAALASFDTHRDLLATPAEQQRLSQRQQAAFSLATQDALQAQDGEAAVEFIEAGRTRFLAAVMQRRHRRPAALPEAVMQRFEAALDRVDEWKRRSRLAGRAEEQMPAAQIQRELARALAERDALRGLVDGAAAAPEADETGTAAGFGSRPPLNGLRDPGAPALQRQDALRFDTLIQAVPPGYAAVYLVAVHAGLGIACAGRDSAGGAWASTWLDAGFPRAALGDLLHRYRAAMASGEMGALQLAVSSACDLLGRRIWPAVARALGGRSSRLILLPGAGFSELPLHAAGLAEGCCAMDRYEIRLAPSLRLLARAHQAAAPLPASATLAQAVDPTHDLPFAAAEATLLAARLGPPQRVLVGDAATADAVQALFARSDIVHFCGHGSFDGREPLLSRLHCAADPSAPSSVLTVRRLIDAAMPMRCGLAVLSACESGRVDASDELDDAIGLPGALLSAGCRGVLASLWRVDDLAACLLMDETMARWQRGAQPLPTALAQAARWLREASAAALQGRVAAWPGAGVPPETVALAGEVIASLDADAPFASPLHWAAFQLTGLPEVDASRRARGWP